IALLILMITLRGPCRRLNLIFSSTGSVSVSDRLLNVTGPFSGLMSYLSVMSARRILVCCAAEKRPGQASLP
ncbi:hypothetical protein LTS18_003665, partial [Coniosporium uncinatum]